MNWTKESLKNKKATINMLCRDEESFKWSVTRALNPSIKSPGRVTKVLIQQSKNYNWEGLDFPTPLEQIETFERDNNLLINVFELNEEKGCVQPLRVSKGVHAGRVLLMLIDDCYTVVKSVSRLLYGQTTKKHCKRFYCNNCLKGFPSEGKLNKHVTLECVYSDVERLTIQTNQTPVETAVKKQPSTSQRLCDLCRVHGKSVCSLHAKLRMSLGKETFFNDFKIFREDVFDPKRTQDIFLDHNEDRYKAIFKEGVWTLSYLGKKRDTKIRSVDGGELGRLAFGRVVRHVCIVCAVAGRMGCPEHSLLDNSDYRTITPLY